MALQSLDYQALSAFRRDLRRFLAFSQDLARSFGIPPQQHQAILAIKGHTDERLSIGDLADALLIKPNTAVELTSRLVEAGLVQRQPAGEDRRKVMLSLTARANEVLEALSEAHLQELHRLEPAMRKLLSRLAHDKPRGRGSEGDIKPTG